VYLSERKEEGMGLAKRSLEQMKHRLDREPDAGGHFLKEGKKEMEAMCILYISMSMFSLDIYAAKPWYIVVSSYLD